jgi:hypothetical protein
MDEIGAAELVTRVLIMLLFSSLIIFFKQSKETKRAIERVSPNIYKWVMRIFWFMLLANLIFFVLDYVVKT